MWQDSFSSDLNLDMCASKKRLNKVSLSMATSWYSRLWNIFTPTGKPVTMSNSCSLYEFFKLRALWPSQRDEKWCELLAGITDHEIKMHWRQICRRIVTSIYLSKRFQWLLFCIIVKLWYIFIFVKNPKSEQLIRRLVTMRTLQTRNYDVHFA